MHIYRVLYTHLDQILKKELDLLRQKKSDLDIKLKSRESDLEALKIATSMLGSNDDKRASKLKQNVMISFMSVSTLLW